MEIPLIAGRYFTEGDRAGTANVMLLNQTLARQVFPNENPVGKRIVLNLKNPTLFEVIGVVGDVRTAGLDEAAFEEFYLHLLQYPPASASFAIKMKLVMFGIAIGMVAAFALTRLMQALLFGVSATDPQTFTLIALLLSSVRFSARLRGRPPILAPQGDYRIDFRRPPRGNPTGHERHHDQQ